MVEEAWKRHLSISELIDWSVYYEWLKCHFLICLCDLLCCGSKFIKSGSGSRSNPDPGFWWPRTKEKNTAENFSYLFLIKNCNLLLPRPPKSTSKLQEKSSALKREHPALQKMKLINFFYFSGSFSPSWIRIRIANPDPGTPLNPEWDPPTTLVNCWWNGVFDFPSLQSDVLNSYFLFYIVTDLKIVFSLAKEGRLPLCLLAEKSSPLLQFKSYRCKGAISSQLNDFQQRALHSLFYKGSTRRATFLTEIPIWMVKGAQVWDFWSLGF